MNFLRSQIGRLFRLFQRHPKNLVNRNQWLLHLTQLSPSKTEHNLIRIGPESDGGYLLPDDLEDLGMCISPGTGSVATFETSLLNYNIKSLLIDKDEVGKPESLPKDSRFLKKFVSGFDSETTVSLDSLVEMSETKKDLILQMDIEGSEYKALSSISVENLNRFRIIIVEFHYTFDWIFKHNWDWTYEEIFAKLLKNHCVVHTHPNNTGGYFYYAGVKYPNIIEITFHRRDRIKHLGDKNFSSHEQDFDNSTNFKTMKKAGIGIK